MLKNIYCSTLNHWCKSLKDAAQIGGVHPYWLSQMLSKSGRAVTKEGMEFVLNPTGNAAIAPKALQKTSKRKSASLKCLETGEIFDSVRMLGKKINVTYVWIYASLRKKGYYAKDGKKYVFIDTQKEHADPRAKALVCLETKEKYACINDLRIVLGTGHGTINRQLALKGKYVKDGKTYVYADSIKNMEEYANTYVPEKPKKQLGRKARSITCIQTGEVFKSATLLSNVIKTSTGHISHCLKLEGQFKKNGYTYVYTDHISPKTTSDGTVIICKETGDRFTSLDLFCKYVKASPETVSNIFKNNGKYVMKDGKIFVLEKVTTVVPVSKEIEKPVEAKVEAPIQEELPVVKIAKK